MGSSFSQTYRHYPAERCSHTPLIGRMWELRNNFTAYGAAYIAFWQSNILMIHYAPFGRRSKLLYKDYDR